MSYTPGIPNANDLISSSQSQIQTNFTQLNTQFAIDHVAFDAGANNGKHKQIGFEGNNAAGAQTGFQSTLYTGAGTADATAPQLFWRNENAIFHFPIKAWAFCNGTAGGIINSQSSNVTSVTRSGTGQYSIVIPANVLGSADYAVNLGVSQASSGGSPDQLSITYTIVSATNFTVKVVNVANNVVIDPTSFSFTVLQI